MNSSYQGDKSKALEIDSRNVVYDLTLKNNKN